MRNTGPNPQKEPRISPAQKQPMTASGEMRNSFMGCSLPCAGSSGCTELLTVSGTRQTESKMEQTAKSAKPSVEAT